MEVEKVKRGRGRPALSEEERKRRVKEKNSRYYAQHKEKWAYEPKTPRFVRVQAMIQTLTEEQRMELKAAL